MGDADGSLEAISYEALTVTSQYEDFHRQGTGWSGLLYDCANAKCAHKLVRFDPPTAYDMRAPGATPSVCTPECAIDEPALALKLDPTPAPRARGRHGSNLM